MDSWKRFPGNPIYPVVPGSWMESQTANPDFLPLGSQYIMYFRGQQGGHDRIGLATVDQEKFDGSSWNVHPDPVIDIGPPGSWDELHVLDPAAVLVKDTVFLYYSAVSRHCSRSICLAVSKDGRNFVKHNNNPVIIGGGPEIVYYKNTFHLYYWKGRKDGGFELFLATSADGYRFTEYSENPVLPAGNGKEWDSHTVETPRIFKEGRLFYMLYCGSDQYDDYPFHAGLATSPDLVHWTKFKANPIFSRGEKGQWDEGAVWFTTVEKINGIYYMWYEGYGGGTARTEPYGSYLKEGKSQIGLATLNAPYFYVQA